MGFFLLFVWGGSRGGLAPQWGDFLRLAYGVGQLRSAEISYAKRKKSHGLSPYEKKENKNSLLCEHNAGSYSLFFALLFAFVDIIPLGLLFRQWFL